LCENDALRHLCKVPLHHLIHLQMIRLHTQIDRLSRCAGPVCGSCGADSAAHQNEKREHKALD
jgi:hypothetical protein